MSTPAAYTPPVDQPPAASPGSSSPYGGFWARLGAHFVDGIIVSIASGVLAVIVILALGASDGAGIAVTLVVVCLQQLYHAYFVSSPRMATPGKRLCGLYVTDADGHRLGFGHALGRNLLALFSYLTLYIGFIMAAFTERKQALHDKMAGTLVHRQPGAGSGVVIAIVVVAFAGVALVGILAAVAIPSYQDYTVRARVHGIYQSINANKIAIAEHALNSGTWPATWEQAGGFDPMGKLDAESKRLVESIRLERDGVIVASFSIMGKTGRLRVAPAKAEGRIQWSCSASPEINRYMPMDCRAK